MTAEYFRYLLEFKRPSGTSRGVLYEKETFILHIGSNGKEEQESVLFSEGSALTTGRIMKRSFSGFVKIFSRSMNI